MPLSDKGAVSEEQQAGTKQSHLMGTAAQPGHTVQQTKIAPEVRQSMFSKHKQLLVLLTMRKWSLKLQYTFNLRWMSESGNIFN